MDELFAVPCDACGEPMVPEREHAGRVRLRWICLSPGCPELAAGELEAEDLAGGGVSTSAGTGSDVQDADALAAHLDDTPVVSHHSGDFAEAQDARQALTAVGALCAVLRRAAGDAQDRLACVEPELPGLLSTDDF